MIKNGYEEKITVKYSEIDQNQALKPYSLLNFLQDIASKNAEDLGFGYSYIHPKKADKIYPEIPYAYELSGLRLHYSPLLWRHNIHLHQILKLN